MSISRSRDGLRVLVGLSLLLAAGVSGVLASEAEGEEPHHKFAAALFLGATRAHGENETTVGVEFGYHFHRKWSVGGLVERADRHEDSTLLLAGVGWLPYRGLRVGVGFGRKDPANTREFVSRLALGYEFELGRAWFIKPYLAKDFINNEENEEVFGAYFGRSF